MMHPFKFARRAAQMNPSVIREILKVTERPGIISFAGGLPAPDTFPLEAFAQASARVLRDHGAAALQYAASEGYGPLREWIANRLPWPVDASQVLITTGSQQGLDLVGKVLVDAGSRVLVETPTYLGALQAFASFEPTFVPLPCDADGPDPRGLAGRIGVGEEAARLLYLVPNFQNPTGRSIGAQRRRELAARASASGLAIVEDDPYGELWFDEPPPAPLAALAPEACIHLGSFSKVLAPGLRVGWLVAPASVFPKLLQAKQAADLHTPGFNQRIVASVIEDGFLDRHVPSIRALYRGRCAAMVDALHERMHGLGVEWNVPRGGMFLWLRLPEGLDATRLLAPSVAAGVAYVPGAAFHAADADEGTLRLSFATVDEARIRAGIATLARVFAEARR